MQESDTSLSAPINQGGEVVEKRAYFITRPHCPCCDSDESELMLDKPYSAPAVSDFLQGYYGGRIPAQLISQGQYSIRHCRRCGLLWQECIPDASAMSALYEQWIDSAESQRKASREEWGVYRRLVGEVAGIRHLLQATPSELAVLDYGMGWGLWCRLAASAGYRVSGLDLSTARQSHVSENGVEVISSISSVADEAYQYVNLEQVLEHVPSPGDLSNELFRIVSRGGYVHVAVPDVSGAGKRLRQPDWVAAKDCLQPLEHINGFDRSCLIRLLESAGFEIVPYRRVSVAQGWREYCLDQATLRYRRYFGTRVLARKPML